MLELVQFGAALDEAEDPVDRGAGQGTIATGPVHESGEHGVLFDDEGRHAEHIELFDAALVLLADYLRGPPGVHLGEHCVGVDPGAGQSGMHHRSVAEVCGLVVTGGEQRPMHG